MLKPLRLLLSSLKQFAIGLMPAMAMAFICLAIQLIVPRLVAPVLHWFFPPKPPQSFDEFMNGLFVEDRDWRDEAGTLVGETVYVTILFFFHALVALVLTAWLLRGRTGWDPRATLRRAVRGAGLLTCAAAVVFAVAFLVDDHLPATRYVRFDFGAAAMVALWFGGTALLLPARLMGHEPAIASGWLRSTFIAAMVLVPWFYASEMLGAPIRHCRDCGGVMDGGVVFYAALGAYFLGLTVSSAAVSAAACMAGGDAADYAETRSRQERAGGGATNAAGRAGPPEASRRSFPIYDSHE